MRLRLQDLQESYSKAQKIRAKGLKEGWEEANEVLHHQSLLFVPKVIQMEFISRQHDDLLAGHLGFDKTWEFIT